MIEKLETYLTARTRAWVYGLSAAVVFALTVYGKLSESEATAWLAVAAALVGAGELGVASAVTRHQARRQ